MEYRQRAYPDFSACGLNCGLCPRYYTEGASRCPGCAGPGFSQKHPACGVLSCCQHHGLEYCFECGEFPCKKYDGADGSDSFITHKNQLRDLGRARKTGMDTYRDELERKIEILQTLLADYDAGRQKSFFCLAVNLLELPGLERAMAQIEAEMKPDNSIKEKSATALRVLEATAAGQDISLKLRKKAKP